MRGWAAVILSGVSLVLCVGAVCLWVRTLGRVDVVGRLTGSGGACGVITSPHRLNVCWDGTAGGFFGRFVDVPRWVALSIPYGTRQSVHLGRRERGGDGFRADVGFVVQPRTPAGGLLGFRWNGSGQAGMDLGLDLNVDVSDVVVSGGYDLGPGAGGGVPAAGAAAASAWQATVPMWFVVGVTAVVPGWRGWWAVRRWRRRARGRCAGCGYDLRASAGRCPECGEEAFGK